MTLSIGGSSGPEDLPMNFITMEFVEGATLREHMRGQSLKLAVPN